jgi:uncharacterized membrane protein YciS (DUF1049 family)
MKALIKALILLPVILLAVGLSVANRDAVTLSLDPFAQGIFPLQIAVPLYALVLAAVAIGVLLGGVAAWLAQGKHRRAARARRLEAHALRNEVDRLRVAGLAPR